jgi:hypothetical protein
VSLPSMVEQVLEGLHVWLNYGSTLAYIIELQPVYYGDFQCDLRARMQASRPNPFAEVGVAGNPSYNFLVTAMLKFNLAFSHYRPRLLHMCSDLYSAVMSCVQGWCAEVGVKLPCIASNSVQF